MATPDPMNQTVAPTESTNSEDTAVPSGRAHAIRLPYRPNTRPRYSGAMRSWMSAICGAEYSGELNPMTTAEARNAGNMEGAAEPAINVATPYVTVANSTLTTRRRNPPVAPMTRLLTSMPAENATSAVAAPEVPLLKWSRHMTGNRALTGEMTNENANPQISRANRPLSARSTRKPSRVSESMRPTATDKPSESVAVVETGRTYVVRRVIHTAREATSAPTTSIRAMTPNPNIGYRTAAIA